MKSIKGIMRSATLAGIAAVLVSLTSCVIYEPAQQATLPVDEIVRLSKDGMSSKDIIKKIRNSHTVYNLKASELAQLSNEGVQDSVLNFMQKTQINAIRRQQQSSDWYWGPSMYYGYPYYGLGYGFGYGFWPYSYWGFGYSPVIIHRSYSYIRPSYNRSGHSGTRH